MLDVVDLFLFCPSECKWKATVKLPMTQVPGTRDLAAQRTIVHVYSLSSFFTGRHFRFLHFYTSLSCMANVYDKLINQTLANHIHVQTTPFQKLFPIWRSSLTPPHRRRDEMWTARNSRRIKIMNICIRKRNLAPTWAFCHQLQSTIARLFIKISK